MGGWFESMIVDLISLGNILRMENLGEVRVRRFQKTRYFTMRVIILKEKKVTNSNHISLKF